MRRLLAVLIAVVLTLGGATVVPATTLTFDDLPGTVAGQNHPAVPNGYGGLNWTKFQVLDGTDSTPGGYHNGVVSPKMVIFNPGGEPAAVSDSPFTFNSAYFTSALYDGLHIRADASLSGSLVYSKEFVVDTTGPTLETFNWSGIDKVLFTSFGPTATHFALDNFTFNEPVPEPSTFVLLSMGAVGLLGYAWRRRKRAFLLSALFAQGKSKLFSGRPIVVAAPRHPSARRRGAAARKSASVSSMLQVFCAGCLLVGLASSASAAPTVAWGRQFGPAYYDNLYEIAADNGGFYCMGAYWPYAESDASNSAWTLSRYDSEGNMLWQDSVPGYCWGTRLRVADGTIYAAGTFPRDSTSFLRAYNPAGQLLWNRTFDILNDFAVDRAGNVLVSSGANLLTKYDPTAGVLWSRNIGDGATRLAVDSRNDIYVCQTIGGTSSPIYCDGRLTKMSSQGDTLWTASIATSREDHLLNVSVNRNDDLYVIGSTSGALFKSNSGNGSDTFIAKYRGDGQQVWGWQSSEYGADGCGAMGEDPQGGLVFCGRNWYGSKGEVGRLSPSGTLDWRLYMGNSVDAVGVADNGAIYLGGGTRANMYAPPQNNDAFLVKMVPEPSTFFLLGMGAIGLLSFVWRRRTRPA